MYIFTENVENVESVSNIAVDCVALNTLAGNIGPCNLQLVLEHLISKMRALGLQLDQFSEENFIDCVLVNEITQVSAPDFNFS